MPTIRSEMNKMRLIGLQISVTDGNVDGDDDD